MRHLLFPKRPPTRLERIRADLQRRQAHAIQVLAEHWDQLMAAGQQWTDPAFLVLVTMVTMPPAYQPGAPVGAIWWQIAILVVSVIISVALAPKAPVPKPASLADFDFPTAEEGRPICKIFGEMLVKDPNVIWYGNLGVAPIKKKGGKK